MQHTPFTHAQATEICEDFEDLNETELVLGSVAYEVVDLVICPFAEPYRGQFISKYLHSHTVRHVSYQEDKFDVLLYVCDIVADKFLFIDIRQYISEKVFNYNFPDV